MLKNAELIDGKQAKEFNQACKEYTDACIIEKDVKKTKEKASAIIKELCPLAGVVYETVNWTITMGSTGGRETCNLAKVKEKAPELYSKLYELGCITFTQATLKMGTPKPKTEV